MKICEVVWDFPPQIVGGLASFSYEVSLQLSSLGHDVTVVTRKTDGAEHFDRTCNFKVERVGDEIGSTKITNGGMDAFKQLAGQYVKKNRQNIDVLHLQDWSAIGLAEEFRGNNFKIMATIHSIWSGDYVEVPEHVIKEEIISSFPYTDVFTTVSNSMRQKLTKIGVNDGRIDTVYNGINTEKYIPFGHATEKNILFFGRLEKHKGLLELLNAMKIVVDVDEDITLAICGRGNLSDKMTKLIDNHDLQKNVRYLGFLSETEKIKMINNSAGVVIPTKYEPFGLVTLEALACNKPVIVTPHGGPREIIGNHGIVLKSIDPLEIANKIIFLFENGNSKAYGTNGRDYVRNNFGWDTTVHKFISILKNSA